MIRIRRFFTDMKPFFNPATGRWTLLVYSQFADHAFLVGFASELKAFCCVLFYVVSHRFPGATKEGHRIRRLFEWTLRGSLRKQIPFPRGTGLRLCRSIKGTAALCGKVIIGLSRVGADKGELL